MGSEDISMIQKNLGHLQTKETVHTPVEINKPFFMDGIFFWVCVVVIVSGITLYYVPWSGDFFEDRLKNNFLSMVAGVVAGAFFSDRLARFRKYFVRVIIIIGLSMAYASNPIVSNVIVFGVSFVITWSSMRRKEGIPKNTTLGSAEWADRKTLANSRVIGSEGLVLGTFHDSKGEEPLHYTGARHLLTVAPTRSGKGVSSVIPNLLTYTGSVLIIDPKGENARITATRRGQGDKKKEIEGLGQRVHVVDPWGITGLAVARFNPLEWLQAGDQDISENAMMLADAIVVKNQNSNEPFWDEEAKALLMGIILYVALDEAEAGNRHLARVRDIIVMGGPDFEAILEKMAANPNRIVSSTAQRTASKDVKLLSSVLASLQSHTHFLDSPRIRTNTASSDFSFEDLKKDSISVYLVLPSDRLAPFGRWLRLLVQQAITVNARNIHIKPAKPILFLLDEMPALGHLAMVEQAYGLMAGFGMQLWGIVQDLSQLEGIYGPGWQTFIGNSGVIQYFGSRDVTTSEYFSKLCGVTTVEKFSFSGSFSRVLNYALGNGPSGGGGGSESFSYSKDTVQRQLAYPDELMTMKDEKQLIFVEKVDPIKAKKKSWYNDPTLKKLGEPI